MEYVQMTMLELEERESSIKTKLGSIVENFLLVGKELDEIDRVSAYQLRGYKSIREYASDTFGISESFASRVLNVYRKYTEPGKELKLKLGIGRQHHCTGRKHCIWCGQYLC